MSHHDVVVVGAGLAGLTAAVRLAEAGARVLVLAKGVGATHLERRHDRRARLRARAASSARREALRAAGRAAGHPYARSSAPTASRAALDWFASASPAGRSRRYAYAGGAGGEPAAADRGRRAAAVARSCPRRWPAATCATAAPVLRRRLPRAQGLPPGAARRQPDRARGVAARARRARPRARGPRRRQRARASRARSTTRRSAARSSPQLARAARRAASASRSPPCSASPTRTRSGRTLEHALGRRGVRGPDAAAVGARACACSRRCASALRRAGGRCVLNNVVVGAERDGRRG